MGEESFFETAEDMRRDEGIAPCSPAARQGEGADREVECERENKFFDGQ